MTIIVTLSSNGSYYIFAEWERNGELKNYVERNFSCLYTCSFKDFGSERHYKEMKKLKDGLGRGVID